MDQDKLLAVEHELSMLQGNINRMCVTTDEKELSDMRDWAKRRIDRIFDHLQDQMQNCSPELKENENYTW